MIVFQSQMVPQTEGWLKFSIWCTPLTPLQCGSVDQYICYVSDLRDYLLQCKGHNVPSGLPLNTLLYTVWASAGIDYGLIIMAAPSVPPHAGSRCRLGLVNIPLLLPRLCFIRRPFSICGGCFVFAAVFDGAGQPRHWQWWIPDLRRLVHNELGREHRLRQAAGFTHMPLPGTAACHMPPCRQKDAGGSPQASPMPPPPRLFLCLRLMAFRVAETQQQTLMAASWSIASYLYCLQA